MTTKFGRYIKYDDAVVEKIESQMQGLKERLKRRKKRKMQT